MRINCPIAPKLTLYFVLILFPVSAQVYVCTIAEHPGKSSIFILQPALGICQAKNQFYTEPYASAHNGRSGRCAGAKLGRLLLYQWVWLKDLPIWIEVNASLKNSSVDSIKSGESVNKSLEPDSSYLLTKPTKQRRVCYAASKLSPGGFAGELSNSVLHTFKRNRTLRTRISRGVINQ